MTSTRRDVQRRQLADQGAKAIELIDAGFTVREVCELLGITRSRYYRARDAYDQLTLI